jgi:hypothetical protein
VPIALRYGADGLLSALPGMPMTPISMVPSAATVSGITG